MRLTTDTDRERRFSRRGAVQSMLSLAMAGSLNLRGVPSASAAAADEMAAMRILFFNSHLLPGIAQRVAGHRGQPDYRATAIGRAIAAYDLIGLCEVFESKRQQQVLEALRESSGQSYQFVVSPPPSGRHVIGGGLLLISRFAIEGKPNIITYRDASRFWRSGFKADGFSAKGAIHVRLRIADQPPVLLDCILTHLESHSAEARQNQIQELAGFIATHSSPQRPLVVLGDLNVTADHPLSQNATDSEYRRMMNALRHGNQPLIDVLPTLSQGRGGTSDALAGESSERIDYILMSPPSILANATLTPRITKIIPFLDNQVDEGSLSDHAGVECLATLKLR